MNLLDFIPRRQRKLLPVVAIADCRNTLSWALLERIGMRGKDERLVQGRVVRRVPLRHPQKRMAQNADRVVSTVSAYRSRTRRVRAF